MTTTNTTTSDSTPAPIQAAVTGVQLAKGIGVRPASGFWAEAWGQVLKRRAPVISLMWLTMLAFFAVYAPVLASGHPLWMTTKDGVGSSPLFSYLDALDLILLVWVTLGLPWVVFGSKKGRGTRASMFLLGLVVAVVILAASGVMQGRLLSTATDLASEARTVSLRTGKPLEKLDLFYHRWYAGYTVSGVIGLIVVGLVVGLVPGNRGRRAAVCGLALVVAVGGVGMRWKQPLERFDYQSREQAGKIQAWYTLIGWSPFQRFSELSRNAPMSSRWFSIVKSVTETMHPFKPIPGAEIAALKGPLESQLTAIDRETRNAVLDEIDALARRDDLNRSEIRQRIDRHLPLKFFMGTDKDGADVLAQVLHACRLSITIGLVSTGIALMIGVTMGAMMGYFGGWIDLVLSRIVEVFMAIPVLFLLIVAIAVLPEELKTTYVIMGIIGCFTWTGMARFTRAEFLKLRNQDFVQSAQAVGLPLWSILFKHMLPNGVAPVLVDTSFAIAAAISLEATLSYLGLGPVDSASWGKLLSSAISTEGEFKWWLAVFPGGAIFLTVLSYNLLGEALRDAIDPKLKKARV